MARRLPYYARKSSYHLTSTRQFNPASHDICSLGRASARSPTYARIYRNSLYKALHISLGRYASIGRSLLHTKQPR